MRRRLAQISLGMGLGLLAALAFVLLGRSPGHGEDPHLLPAPFSVPTTTLTDHRGEARALPGDHDGPSVVFFGYTSCPDVCPLTMARLARVVETLEAEGATAPRVVFVSVDPDRDSPERIATWLGRFDEDFVGLTGSRGELEATLSAWGVYASDPSEHATHPSDGSADAHGPEGSADATGGSDPESSSGPEPVLLDHTGRAFLLDRTGRVVGTFPSDATADAIVATLRNF